MGNPIPKRHRLHEDRAVKEQRDPVPEPVPGCEKGSDEWQSPCEFSREQEEGVAVYARGGSQFVEELRLFGRLISDCILQQHALLHKSILEKSGQSSDDSSEFGLYGAIPHVVEKL